MKVVSDLCRIESFKVVGGCGRWWVRVKWSGVRSDAMSASGGEKCK